MTQRTQKRGPRPKNLINSEYNNLGDVALPLAIINREEMTLQFRDIYTFLRAAECLAGAGYELYE